MSTRLILIFTVLISKSQSLEIQKCTNDGCKLGAKEMASWMDPSVNPCENFYDFACGGFSKLHPLIPSAGENTNLTSHIVSSKKIRSDFIDILTTMKLADKNTPRMVRLVAHTFQSCVKAQGLQPEESAKLLKSLYEYWFEKVINNATWENFWIYSRTRTGLDWDPLLLDIHTQISDNETERQINIRRPEGLGKRDEKSKMLAVAKIICSMHSKQPKSCQDENIEKGVNDIINLEIQLYAAGNLGRRQNSRVLLKDVNQLLGFDFKHTLRKLFHIMDVLEQTDNPDLEFQFNRFPYVKEINKLLKNTSADILFSYFGWKLFSTYGGLLSKDIKEFEAPESYDLESTKTVEDYCMIRISQYIPSDTYMYIYSKRVLSDEERAAVEQMVNDIKSVFKENLEANDWLDNETREKALFKLSKMSTSVADAERMEAFEEKGDSFYGMSEEVFQELINDPNYVISLFKFSLMVKRVDYSKLEKPIDMEKPRQIWTMDDFSPNAFYVLPLNKIEIPVTILRPTFFSFNRLFIQNYGRFGSIIGHEITHGFDPRGSKFDAYGKEHDWWTTSAKERFQKRSECFIKDASSFKDPLTGKYANGTRTIRENVADSGGLHIAYEAFQKRQKEERIAWKLGEGLSNYTSEQLFFISFAQNRCLNADKAWNEEKLARDDHPLHRYRAEGTLRNFDKWYDAFNCEMQKKNGMVMCKLW